MTILKPGDKIYFRGKTGMKLRGVVVDSLGLKVRGEELLVPVQRPRRSVKASVMSDHEHRTIREIKTRWLKRSELRKLPD